MCEQDAVQLHPKQGTYFYISTKVYLLARESGMMCKLRLGFW